ncbi:DUF1613-domain-containing protein [Pleomassaria siparia CBS 279.74]|uniref:tRNA (uracil-O(2)-)-methyltransferase n=1 Tax=Pleomassaria siparia CBS 279.74 TaxID=1314801 RepID=A0A6G1K5W5_9PLEO|nr:DUF1613-domain-containing protein [Pleomassaria siparia CBS 279.74]
MSLQNSTAVVVGDGGGGGGGGGEIEEEAKAGFEQENSGTVPDDDNNSRCTPGLDDQTRSTPQSRPGDKFEPVDIIAAASSHPSSGLPPEIWTLVQSAPANFTPHYFLEVSRNLLENPNLTASHLSRAELSYQSFTDASFNPSATHPHDLAKIIRHLKPDHQPLLVDGGVPGYALEWTVVRKLIPRNPKLDESLLQTCHLFTSNEDVVVRSHDGKAREEDEDEEEERTIKAERYLVVYLPHATDPDKIPFYHPKIRGLAILYTYHPTVSPGKPLGTLSLYYDLFPQRPLDNRMTRTALKMLEIIHKHSRGRMAGYQKRVHHDIVIAQKPFQDTYAYLKGKYCKGLIDAWVEQTPAEKHVFEDLGIAAFLIELWTGMYGGGNSAQESAEFKGEEMQGAERNEEIDLERANANAKAKAKTNFPGFVDIGCGNGILVWILNQEGWSGWGFDARRRKTWATFDSSYDDKLKEMLLVPEVLNLKPSSIDVDINVNESLATTHLAGPATHNGIFPTGTFIVANHADELTIWTPCLAFLSESPFIAIPCCSHNFGGTRFRAPRRAAKAAGAPLAENHAISAPAKPKGKPATQSAYSTFCSYVSHVTSLMDYVPESEYLRIPSTRNFAVLGREKQREGERVSAFEDRMAVVRGIVEKEMATSIEVVREAWVERGSGLMKPGTGSGH